MLQIWDKVQEAEPGVLAATFDPQGKPTHCGGHHEETEKTEFLGDIIEPWDQFHLKTLNLRTV